MLFFPFKDNSLPNAKQMLHAQAHQAMPIQQHRPIKMGLPPVLTSLTILVLKPIRRHSHNNEELGELLYGRGHARR